MVVLGGADKGNLGCPTFPLFWALSHCGVQGDFSEEFR